MHEVKIQLTEPQEAFVFSKARHPAMVAGFGAGKSEAAVVRLALQALQYPRMNFAFVEPTFDLVRLIAWPRFAGIFERWGIGFELNKGDNIGTLENGSQIIFRSADAPERLVGFEVADAIIDEIDTLKEAHASDVWTKMLGRCRQSKPDGAVNTLAAVSTPEGFKFVYKTWGRDPKPGYELIKAPTNSNPYLPAGYVEQLRAAYSSAQLSAYLDGDFVNLVSGSVYSEFDRQENGTFETIRVSEPLHIGMDFNVGNMSAVIGVMRQGNPMALDELTGVRDTPAMIDTIKSRYKGHAINIYPDASGGSRKSINASLSDIVLLRNAGFTVLAHASNPPVKDRVLALSQMIHNQGKRRLLVNPDRCPSLTEALEQQAYDKNGEPDKANGLDHLNDALGYFIFYKYGISRGPVRFAQIMGA
jgi:hypothetical protein